MTRHIEFKVPIWKTRSVGIDVAKVKGYEDLTMEITYTENDGKRTFPNKYHMTTDKIKTYPTTNITIHTAKSIYNLKTYVVPIKDFDIIK